MVWGYCMLMRGFSIALTSLPATENHCQDPKVIDDVWVNTVVGFLTFGGKNVHCGDLMFSGHTIAIMNGTCFVAHYARMFPVLVVATMMCSCMCVFLIIASRSHYTIDVYVAGCISFLTFKSTPEALPTFLAPVSNMFAKLGVNSLLLLPRR
ncbi:Phosphatidylinositol:ceramide inositolphosphotransferase, partial [Diplonema papillatum]